MTLCALGFAAEFADDGIASNALWPRTLIATAAVQNLLGGDEAMAHARRPELYADAAYAVISRPSRDCTGKAFLCEDVLASEGVTDFDRYAYLPGAEPQPDLFVDHALPQRTLTRTLGHVEPDYRPPPSSSGPSRRRSVRPASSRSPATRSRGRSPRAAATPAGSSGFSLATWLPGFLVAGRVDRGGYVSAGGQYEPLAAGQPDSSTTAGSCGRPR
jgi:hypothetical protein